MNLRGENDYHRNADRGQLNPVLFGGFSGSKEDTQSAGAYLFSDAAARLQQYIRPNECSNLGPPERSTKPDDTYSVEEGSIEDFSSFIPDSQVQERHLYPSRTPAHDNHCLDSFATYHSNCSRSTLASSNELDPDFGYLQKPTSASKAAVSDSRNLNEFHSVEEPYSPEVDKDKSECCEFSPSYTLDSLHSHTRPSTFRRALTSENRYVCETRDQESSAFGDHLKLQQSATLRKTVSRESRKQLGLEAKPQVEDDCTGPSLPASYETAAEPFSNTASLARSPPREFSRSTPKSTSCCSTSELGQYTATSGPKSTLSAKEDLESNNFPPPYNFSTHNSKSSFDPLNFIPGGVNHSGSLYLPTPRSQPDQSPSNTLNEQQASKCECDLDNLTNNLDQLNATDPDTLSITQRSVPYCELPVPRCTENDSQKTRKKGTRRFTLSLKKVFSRKSKSDSENKSPSSHNHSRTDCPLALFEQHLRKPYITVKVDPPSEIVAATPLQPETPIMSTYLDPSSAITAVTKQKSEAMRLAREQGLAVTEMCRRAKTDIPPYSFEELIGKGSYGRVYKGHHLPSQSVVAIKVMDIDKVDYTTVRDFKDESIKDFIHETRVMKQVKDAGAKNINMLIEAVSIHSQLWLVCEYCPGGSVKTLMRATGDKLDERFIIPIARELAEGLKAIHNAGIIHRDVKAGNVLIHEEGNLQICDFGVAGVLQNQVDKRSTWIGTPHWMPPELFPNRPKAATQYGNEIDVWAYGCTLFECATGNPPNSTLRERIQIGRQLNRFAPKLEGDEFSDDLRSLVSFALNSEPASRPSMADILEHPYIADSEELYPTSSLRELVKIYYQWSQRGGQRISLFNPGGAAAAEIPGNRDSLDDEVWNFSTTAGFEKRFSLIDLDELSASLAALQNEQTPTVSMDPFEQYNEFEEEKPTAEERANFDERVKRGAAAMEGIFNEEKPDYKYETKNDFVPVERKQQNSDLPLRTETDRSSVASTFIDINLGVYESSHYASASGTANPPFQLADADTIRANRFSSRLYRNSGVYNEQQEEYPQDRGPRPPTMDWKFPSAPTTEEENTLETHEEDSSSDDPSSREEKRDTRAWTFPVMVAEEDGPGEEAFREDPASDTPTAWRTDTEDPSVEIPRQLARHRPSLSQNRSIHGRDNSQFAFESRPSTSASDADYDPFRLDRDTDSETEQNGSKIMLKRASSMREPSVYHRGNQEDVNDANSGYESSIVDSLPESLTLRNSGTSLPFPSHSEELSMYSDNERGNSITASGTENRANLVFPELRPPSTESLMEGASDETVSAELDRMFEDLIQGLTVTGEAISAIDTTRAAEVDDHSYPR